MFFTKVSRTFKKLCRFVCFARSGWWIAVGARLRAEESLPTGTKVQYAARVSTSNRGLHHRNGTTLVSIRRMS